MTVVPGHHAKIMGVLEIETNTISSMELHRVRPTPDLDSIL